MKFSKDYEKLGWVVFTTIRKNTENYKLGHIYTIKTPQYSFKAKVIGLLPIKKKDITENLAQVDADVTAETLKRKLENWYGKEFNDYLLITLLGI